MVTRSLQQCPQPRPLMRRPPPGRGLRQGPSLQPLHLCLSTLPGPMWTLVSLSALADWSIRGSGGLTWKTWVGGRCPEIDVLCGCCMRLCFQRLGFWKTVLRVGEGRHEKGDIQCLKSECSWMGMRGLFQVTKLGQTEGTDAGRKTRG